MNENIQDFLNGKNDLWDLIDDITYTMVFNNNDIISIIKYLETLDSDEAMIATVLFWVFPNSPFKDIETSNNSFFRLLFSIIVPHGEFFDSDIIWYYINDNSAVFEKNNYLFIINNNAIDISSQVPDKFMNSLLYCHNCNEEMTVTHSILVPSKTFYILEKC